MAIHYQTQGFILKKTDLREADQIFTIYTKNFGKFNILGKAIRKIKSKLRPGADLFYLSEIDFIQGRAYKTLTEAIAIEKFRNLRNNLAKLKVAYQIAGVVDDLIKGQEEDEKIWGLINEVFNKLDNCSLLAVPCSLIYHYFLWNLLSILGYQIDLYNCAFCQKKLVPQKLHFNPERGIVCSECAKKTRNEPILTCSGRVSADKEISPEVIKILRLFLKKDWQTLSKLRIAEPYKESLKSVSENYFSFVHG